MDNRGYILIWRKMLDSGLMQMPNTLVLFIHILINATHKDIKSGMIELKRGQYISGRKKLAKELKQSEQNIRTSLKKLEELKILTIKTTNEYSIYTIEKYDIYQNPDNNLTKPLTNDQPTGNQRVTTKQTHNTQKTYIYSLEFEEFWSLYPRHDGKAKAFNSWKSINPDLEAIKKALSWQIKANNWTQENKQFIPMPQTYLNQLRWTDEKPSISTTDNWLKGMKISGGSK